MVAHMATANDLPVAFTPADMDLLTELAARCFKKHRWVAVARRMETHPKLVDAMAVALAEGGWPSVTIEREASGGYRVCNPEGSVLSAGTDLRGVLLEWDATLDLP